MKFVTKSQLQDVVEYMGENIHVPQLVQHFNGENIYSTDEQVIGCWVDGRPIYKKTIIKAIDASTGANGTSLVLNLTNEIPDVGSVITEKVMAKASNSSNAHNSPVYNGTFTEIKFKHDRMAANNEVKFTFTNYWSVSVEVYLIVAYTKTTDATNSFNIAKENNYNTAEKVIGKWIDGKPVYQKTIDFGALPNSTSKSVNHEINNLDLILSIEGIVYQNTSKDGFLCLNDHKTDFAWATRVSASKTTVTIGASVDRSPFSAYITLKYTKTTN